MDQDQWDSDQDSVAMRPSTILAKAVEARCRATAANPVVLVHVNHSVDGWTTLYAIHLYYDGVWQARMPLSDRFDEDVGAALSLADWATLFDTT